MLSVLLRVNKCLVLTTYNFKTTSVGLEKAKRLSRWVQGEKNPLI